MEYTVWTLHRDGTVTVLAANVDGARADDIVRDHRLAGSPTDRVCALPSFIAADAFAADEFRRVAVGPRR